MSDAPPATEPSIEEILGSIRRIIADDDAPAGESSSAPTPRASDAPPAFLTAAEDDDEDDTPLELTQKIDADGTVIDLHRASETYDDDDTAATEREADAAEELPLASRTRQTAPREDAMDMPIINFNDETDTPRRDPLVSQGAANATAAVMAKLARNTAVNRAGHESGTLEDLVKEMLRPLLREWLDQNLPDMVQSMVERELEKISRRVG